MRKADRDRDMVLPPETVDALIHKYKLPLTPCLPFLHKKFRDKRFIGSTNYEHVMRFLENSRRERHKIGPEEIQDWKQEQNSYNQDSWIRNSVKGEFLSSESGPENRRYGKLNIDSVTGDFFYNIKCVHQGLRCAGGAEVEGKSAEHCRKECC